MRRTHEEVKAEVLRRRDRYFARQKAVTAAAGSVMCAALVLAIVLTLSSGTPPLSSSTSDKGGDSTHAPTGNVPGEPSLTNSTAEMYGDSTSSPTGNVPGEPSLTNGTAEMYGESTSSPTGKVTNGRPARTDRTHPATNGSSCINPSNGSEAVFPADFVPDRIHFPTVVCADRQTVDRLWLWVVDFAANADSVAPLWVEGRQIVFIADDCREIVCTFDTVHMDINGRLYTMTPSQSSAWNALIEPYF